MGFYEQLSKYYDDIFSPSTVTVNFIASVAGKPERKILDVACGTGGHSLALAKKGFNVTSTDLDEKMIMELNYKAKEQQLEVTTVQGNMLGIHREIGEQFDLIFCIGNSIVHLDSKEEIQIFFSEVLSSLHENGKFIVQVVNFDKVMLSDNMRLPLIQKDAVGIKFERVYKKSEDEKVIFSTILTVDNSKESLVTENNILLIPLNSVEIVDMLAKAGFSKIALFGDFDRSEYIQNSSSAIIALAEK